MSDNQSEAISVLERLRANKVTPMDRSAAVSVATDTASNSIQEAARNNGVIGESTKARLEAAALISDDKQRQQFIANTLAADADLTAANSTLPKVVTDLVKRI